MTARHDVRDGAGVAVGVVVLGAIVSSLHLLGRGALAAPPVGTLDQLSSWATANDPVTVGLVLVRLLALGVGYHLIATTALGLVGRVLHRPRLSGWAERATLPVFRSAVRRAAGLGLSASVVLVTPLPTVGADPAVTSESVVLERLAPDSADPGSAVVLERIEPAVAGPGEASLRAVAVERSAPIGVATLRAVEVPAAGDAHVVRVGDHLWALAEARMAEHLGRAPTDAEVDRYWRQVVAANPQLTDPDVLFPGDTVRLPLLTSPAPPAPPAGEATLRLAPG